MLHVPPSLLAPTELTQQLPPIAVRPPSMMRSIADVYERELDRTVKTISALIPPVIIVLIVIVVGFVVYSILSAVFEMTHSLQVRPS